MTDRILQASRAAPASRVLLAALVVLFNTTAYGNPLTQAAAPSATAPNAAAATQTLTGCQDCHDQACGPPCPDGSPSAICASDQGPDACGCVVVGCTSPCATCSCTGDRDGDGTVTIDEVVAAVDNALGGCPELRWFLGCGPPFGGSDECPSSVEVCTTQQIGAGCSPAGATCCQPGSGCLGNWCNAPLVCSTMAPSLCPISRRRYKQDIEYVSGRDLARLYDQLRTIRLARFRYKSEPPSAASHLGFIIEDIEPSPSIDSTHNRVDLYGYLSMAVAAIQVQAREIAALKAETDRLRETLERSKDKPHP